MWELNQTKQKQSPMLKAFCAPGTALGSRFIVTKFHEPGSEHLGDDSVERRQTDTLRGSVFSAGATWCGAQTKNVQTGVDPARSLPTRRCSRSLKCERRLEQRPGCGGRRLEAGGRPEPGRRGGFVLKHLEKPRRGFEREHDIN